MHKYLWTQTLCQFWPLLDQWVLGYPPFFFFEVSPLLCNVSLILIDISGLSKAKKIGFFYDFFYGLARIFLWGTDDIKFYQYQKRIKDNFHNFDFSTFCITLCSKKIEHLLLIKGKLSCLHSKISNQFDLSGWGNIRLHFFLKRFCSIFQKPTMENQWDLNY